ncbi:MAG: NUDIX domain-containing protein [Anaerolineaceae bacterium]|nr:NUDIX domain-containing protein [Anaerolineaceae bacterium]
MSRRERQQQETPIRRVRAILLTKRQTLLFIVRQKEHKAVYWVAPGGGLHPGEEFEQALYRELREELGAEIEILQRAFILRHEVAEKDLEEHFYICRLLQIDLNLRHGPEFQDPSRGRYDPVEVSLDEEIIATLPLRTHQLQEWLMEQMPLMRGLAFQQENRLPEIR